MAKSLMYELTNKHKNSTEESGNNSNEIESEGTLPDINNEIIHPNLSNVLQRQIIQHKRKRTLSPPQRKQSPSDSDPFEQLDSPSYRDVSPLSKTITSPKIIKQI